MITTLRAFRTLALGLIACTALAAQERSPWDAGASLVYPLDGLKAVTQTSGLGGFTLEGGYNGLVRGSSLPFRASFSLNVLPGREKAFVKSSLLGAQVAVDTFAPVGLARTSLVMGLSLNQWRWDYQDATHHTTSTQKGAKMGARFGVDHQVSPRLTASVLLQVVELGTDSRAIHAYNPSWIQVGARYRF